MYPNKPSIGSKRQSHPAQATEDKAKCPNLIHADPGAKAGHVGTSVGRKIHGEGVTPQAHEPGRRFPLVCKQATIIFPYCNARN